MPEGEPITDPWDGIDFVDKPEPDPISAEDDGSRGNEQTPLPPPSRSGGITIIDDLLPDVGNDDGFIGPRPKPGRCAGDGQRDPKKLISTTLKQVDAVT